MLKGLLDFSAATSTGVMVAKVTVAMHTRHLKSFIGLSQSLEVGETISITGCGYKIIKQMPWQKNERMYQIRRLDGFSIVSLDLQRAIVGTRVQITSRRSYEQQINNIFRDAKLSD